MTLAELRALMPLLIVAGAPVALMLVVAFKRDRFLAVLLAGVALAAALVVLLLDGAYESAQVTPLVIIDGYGRFFVGLIFGATLAVVLLSYGFFQAGNDRTEEFYILLLLGTLGAAVLAVSSHFVSFFLSLEILSVSLFGLIAYPREQQNRIEAGLKYLILAGVSTGFLLFGIALVYAASGSMDFASIGSAYPGTLGVHSWIFLAGLGLILVGIGFKLAVVPFHQWAPDVYQGAPAPVTAYVATVSKGAVFALLVRLIGPADAGQGTLATALGLLAIASMLAGNLLALMQTNVKRILAYSSIAHTGYLLVAFLAGGHAAVEAVAFYLLAYTVTTLAAFGTVTVLSEVGDEAGSIEDYRGLFWRRPWLAGGFTAALLSLAGIPATAGFIGKFYVVLVGVGSTLWVLVAVLVVTSVIGLFYYLRIIVALFSAPPGEAKVLTPAPSGALWSQLTMGLLVLMLLGAGIYPGPVLSLVRAIVAPF